MADFERSIKPAFFMDVPMFGFRRDKATGISRKRRQELLMTADIDAKLPNRPSLEGYEIDVLSLDSVVHLFKRFAKSRA